MPKLSDHDLKQMDAAWLQAQPDAVVRSVCERVLDELRIARDRLNQTPNNSSRPPGSMPPWQRADAGVHEAPSEGGLAEANANPQAEVSPPIEQATKPTQKSLVGPPGQAGRRKGSPGHGRMQKLMYTQREEHHPDRCAACQSALTPEASSQAWTGWDTLELVDLQGTASAPPQRLGLRIEVTRHLLMQQRCRCGHLTQALPKRAEEDAQWLGVDICEQRLLGPRLSAIIVYLCLRMALTRRKTKELMWELFGLSLSTALIDQTIHQSARSIEPLEAQLAQELEHAALVHVDETSWPESGVLLWLWVLCTPHTALYVIGSRAKEMLTNALSLAFAGVLMSDGYGAYRDRLNRLRCWAHLKRKLCGVAESTDRTAALAGAALLETFKELMDTVYMAREQMQKWQAQRPADLTLPRPEPPSITHAHLIEKMRQLCEQHRNAGYPALRAVAREFLNDWDAIMRVLAQPHMPLTNNAAERQLRHWVIARRISYGTRTLVGSNSLAILASVIDTCRLRRASVTNTLAQAIHAARQGLSAPALPPIPAELLGQRLTLVGA